MNAVLGSRTRIGVNRYPSTTPQPISFHLDLDQYGETWVANYVPLTPYAILFRAVCEGLAFCPNRTPLIRCHGIAVSERPRMNAGGKRK